ncbi:sensor histidine kinase [Pelagerythrobacter aerophilus]|nr:ATP-binding protein [Pelagerythrobacter aerophilus]
MRLWAVATALMLLAALWGPGVAAQEHLPAINLHAGEDAPAVAPYVRYTRDVGDIAAVPPAQVLAAATHRIQGRGVHFGPPGDRTAVAMKVRNASEVTGSWVLTTGRGSLSHFHLYEVNDGQLELVVDGTDPEAARENLRTYQAFSTELALEPGQEKTILIDFLSENSTYMPLRIETYGTFFKDRRVNIAMVSGVVLGVAVLIFLNFMFFSITGHREFVWLAVAEVFFAFNTIHSEGYFTIFFLPDAPLLGIAIEDSIKCAFAVAMAQFARSFVRTAETFPRRDLVLKTLIAAGLAVIVLQSGLVLYDQAFREVLHIGTWFITVAVALFLPFLGFAAMRQIGRQLWPLLVGWGSLALFIIYAAIASMGVFAWLPVNWHLAGPVGLFESIMVTLALGLNLKKIRAAQQEADANYARSMAERLAISERAKQLAEEKAFALATVNSQNALLHASGHDSRQVILALNSAIDVLKRSDETETHRELAEILQSSSNYLSEIASTTISGAAIVGNESGFIALSAFKGQALIEPLMMMFRTLFAGKSLTLTAEVEDHAIIVSDRPMLMRALANLLSNSYHYTEAGGATVSLRIDGARAIIGIGDTGVGMTDAMLRQLTDDTVPRTREEGAGNGTGSGFRSAKRLIERLSGSLEIVSSGPSGTRLQIALPCAQAAVTPCTASELGDALPGWHVLDFDRREAFRAELKAGGVAKARIAAATYDDTTVTRGRLSETVGMMLIKPLCCEMREHPALAAVSEEV